MNYNFYIIIKYFDFWKQYLKNNYSPIIDIFTFTYLTKIECDTCKNISCQFEPENILKISIPKQEESIDMSKLIENEFKVIEKLEGCDKYYCNICNCKQDAIKTINICNFPDRLIIQIKRFDYKLIKIGNSYHQNISKIDTKINFKLDNLDLKEIELFQNQNESIYELYGIIIHMGNPSGGHYTAYCKNMLNNKWYYFDDDDVYYVTEDEILSSNPYIFLYKKNIKMIC